MPLGSPLNDFRLLRRGFNADREAVSLRQQETVSPGAGQQPALEVFGQIKGVAHGGYGGGVLLQEQLEGGVL